MTLSDLARDSLLISEESAHRQQTRLDPLARRARFLFFKTIDDFNFIHQSTVRLSLLGSALAPDFVTDGRFLIRAGNPNARIHTWRLRSRIGRFRIVSVRGL